MTDLAPRELRILLAVAETGGFTAAGTRLGLTQSAVSRAVAATERRLGVALFERDRAGARATPAGERVLGHARRALHALEALAADARASAETADRVAGPVRIAAFRSIAVQLLPPVLARLRVRYPEVEPSVTVVADIGAGTAGEVAAGRADLALATLGSDPPPGLVARPLLEETYALVHPAGHPEPRTLPLVDWAENCGSYTREWWALQDWLPTATVRAEDDGTVLSLVARGLGMAVMPELSLSSLPAGLAVTDLGPDRPTRTIGYVTTPDAGPAVRAVVRELRAAHRTRVSA
ncbi:LysR family transcriptional regulator [Nocardioides luteus]|uniref:LysR family transcriptional regulator n=1 Tax=Nocardioides luteus TaxID=1844 RepID=A0A1J4N068_9ACTN|nr:LysR family transcriptional regulator [Nocardioides luteus]OIJ24982.1 LysR family transcriptional regulator [Nocardioides luteus]